MCINLYNSRGFIFIPHINTILADYSKAQFYLEKPTLINKTHCLPNQDCLVSKLAQKTPRRLIGTKPCPIPFFCVPFSTWYSFLSPILWHVPKNGVNTCLPVSEWHIFSLRNYFSIIIISFKRLPRKCSMTLWCKRLINPESQFFRWGHLINMSAHFIPLPSPHFLAPRPFLSLLKNSSVPPPSKSSAYSPITRGFS